MTALILVVSIAAGLGAVHLVLRWMEDRGWIHYRRRGGRPMGVAAQNALIHFEAVFNPAAEHVIEEMNRQAIELATSGEPTNPNGDER